MRIQTARANLDMLELMGWHVPSARPTHTAKAGIRRWDVTRIPCLNPEATRQCIACARRGGMAPQGGLVRRVKLGPGVTEVSSTHAPSTVILQVVRSKLPTALATRVTRDPLDQLAPHVLQANTVTPRGQRSALLVRRPRVHRSRALRWMPVSAMQVICGMDQPGHGLYATLVRQTTGVQEVALKSPHV